MSNIERDQRIIAELGGPSKVAEMLGFDKDGGVQRVHNWLTRGIPPAIKVSRPDLFMPELAATTAEADPQATDDACQPVLILDRKKEG